MTKAIVVRVEGDYVITAEGAGLLSTLASQASDARDEAVSAAAAALAAAGVGEYPDTGAGLSGTTEGETFWVDLGDGTGQVYRHDPGPTATALRKFIIDPTDSGAADIFAGGVPTSAALASPAGADMVGAGAVTLDFDIRAVPQYYGVFDDANAANPALAIDQAVTLQAWLDGCIALKIAPRVSRTLRVHSGSTLTFNPPGKVNLYASLLTIWFGDVVSGFVVGSETSTLEFCCLELPGTWRHTVDWSGTHQGMKAGQVIHSCYGCHIVTGRSHFWTIGRLFKSKHSGFSTNVVSGDMLASNRYNEVCIADGPNGYFNENQFNKLDSSEYSTTSSAPGTEQSGNRYGTVLTSINGALGSCNNNHWQDPSYQGIDVADKISIPVWIDGVGSFNYWHNPRWETGRGPFMLVNAKQNSLLARGVFNEVIGKGYDGGTANQQFRIQQVGGAYGNIYRGKDAHDDVWHSGDLRDVVYSGGTAGRYRVMGDFYLKDPGNGTAYREIDVATAFYTNVHGLQFTYGGIFHRFDTTKIKTFLVQSACLKGHEGRMWIEAFDIDGNRLMNGTTDGGFGFERYVKNDDLEWNAGVGGGCFIGQADNTNNAVLFSVRDEVASVGIGFVSGTNHLVISGFSVKGFSVRNDASLSIVQGGVRPMAALATSGLARAASANPSASGQHGWYGIGERVGRNPIASGEPEGWACSVGGPLGTPYSDGLLVRTRGQVIVSSGNAYETRVPGTSSGAGPGGGDTNPALDLTYGTLVLRYIGPAAVFLPLADVP